MISSRALHSTTAAAGRATGWLARAWSNRDADDASVAVDVLALSELCRLLAGKDLPDRIDKEVAEAVSEPAWPASSMTTCLVAAVAAIRAGSRLAASARRYLDMLGELASELPRSPNATLLRHVLYGSDRLSAYQRLPSPDRLVLRDGTERLRQFVAEIETASAFGTRAVITEPASAPLLEGAAIAAFRLHDLPLAMRVLRARLYIDVPDAAGLRMCFHCLQHKQCPDGSFGDYDSALAQIAATGERDGALRLKLPVTFQALWTMAEYEHPEFRLVRSAGLAGGYLREVSTC
jgi:hypothetical protein